VAPHITRFGRCTGGHADDQVATPNGGYRTPPQGRWWRFV